MTKKFILYCNIILGVIILYLGFASFFKSSNSPKETTYIKISADGGWIDQNGEDAWLSDIHYTNGKALLKRNLKENELNGAGLSFISTNVNFNVYLDDDLIYSYHPHLEPIYGDSYGNDVHLISIPFYSGTKTLSIEAFELGDGAMWAGFQSATFESGASYFITMFQKNLWKYLISFLVFITGAILFATGLLFRTSKEGNLEMISLGLLSMVMSIWTNSGTLTMELITENAGFIRLINYFTLMVIPLAGLSLAACLTKHTKSKGLFIVGILCALNILLHLICLCFGITDYHTLLLLTHVTFVIAVAVSVFMIVQSLKKKKISEGQPKAMLIALMLLVGSGVADLAFYYLGGSKDMSRFSRFGLLLFVFVLGFYEMREIIKVVQKSHEAEIMKKLAHEDGLTKLENRLSFSEYEEELKKQEYGSCIIVQFDINNLKKVNDQYGHAEGDKFIIGGSKIILESFGSNGRIFRTGGDEFIGVIRGSNPLESFHSGERIMKEKLDNYNREETSPVPLSIAYGMAEYDFSTKELERQEKLADDRMYRHKKELKARMQQP